MGTCNRPILTHTFLFLSFHVSKYSDIAATSCALPICLNFPASKVSCSTHIVACSKSTSFAMFHGQAAFYNSFICLVSNSSFMLYSPLECTSICGIVITRTDVILTSSLHSVPPNQHLKAMNYPNFRCIFFHRVKAWLRLTVSVRLPDEAGVSYYIL